MADKTKGENAANGKSSCKQACSSNGCGKCPKSAKKPNPAGPAHPLNQLDEQEIRQAVTLVKTKALSENISQAIVFAVVSLKEPPKRELLPYLGGEGPKPARKAISVFHPKGVNLTYEAIINLDSNLVERFTQLPEGTHPSFTSETPSIIQRIVVNDERVLERARKAGVMDKELLITDEWSYGHNGTEDDKKGMRLMDVYLLAKEFPGSNHYSHPLDFIVTVDMISEKVIDIINMPVCPGKQEPSKESRPIRPPERSHEYDPRVLPKDFYRNDIKPLQITQKDGPSFDLEENRIKWQNWDMLIGFNYREGLTLHNITFKDGDKTRGVLYRAAISEMVVPYGDPQVPFHRRAAFDLGEYGIGYNANSLTNGCDCLGEIRYLDFVFPNSKGEPQVLRNAICIHEEDAGLLQKHTDTTTGNVTIARSRRLVISFIATVTNYEYAFYWIFYQDGTIVHDIKATGLLSVYSLLDDTCGTGGYGTIVAPRISAPYHQHIFCARLDLMVDGPNNSVTIQEVVPLKEPCGSKRNPFGNGFTTTSKTLERASESGTDTDADKVRSWLMTNENVIHPYTKNPVAWKLVTPGFCRMLAAPESPIGRRAAFARHNVWVTPYNDDQLYAAGTYINQMEGGKDGVNIWAERDNGNIRNTDIVLWHSFGLTHIPRVEDFPLMPTEGVSFMLRPSNFFTANPALDVPAPPPKEEKKCCSCNC